MARGSQQPRLRWAFTAASTGLVVVLAAGCSHDAASSAGPDRGPTGSTATSPSPASPSQPADAVGRALAAQLATSARVATTSTVMSSGQAYTVRIVGSYDFARSAGRLDVSLPGGATPRLTEVLTPDAVLVNRAANLPAGKWAVLSRNDSRAHYILRTPANDPSALLRQAQRLTWAAGGGPSEAIDGRDTVKYTSTMDVDTAVLYLADAQLEQRVRNVLATAAKSSAGIQASAWIDTAGTLARVAFDLSVGEPTINGLRTTLTLDLNDTGLPVKVAPPRSTMPVSELTGILTG